AVVDRRRHRHRARSDQHVRHRAFRGVANADRSALHRGRLRLRGGRGHLLRVLSGQEGSGTGPHRGLEVRMTPRLLALSAVLFLAPTVGLSRVGAETYTPQSPSGLNVTFTTEKGGGTRILVFGEVRNSTTSPAQRVVVLVEGLDENGRVVSRARG